MADIKFTSNVNDILSALENGKRNALTAIGATAETHTKENITADKLVDTGRLRNSITYATGDYSGIGTYTDNNKKKYSDAKARNTPKDDEVAIGTNVEYAPYLELGTKKIAAHHYLKRAVTEHKDEYKKLTVQAIKTAINNLQ